MDWNSPLLLLTVFSCASVLWRAFRQRDDILHGWLYKAIFILLATGILYFTRRNICGFVGFGLWALLVLLPTLLSRQAQRQEIARRFSAAAFLSGIAAILHPFDGWPQEARLLAALRLWQRGSVDRAVETLQELSLRGGRSGFVAECHRLHILARWNELAGWLQHAAEEGVLHDRPELLAMYLRALGETGALSELLQVYWHVARHLDSPASRPARSLAMFFALAFGGRAEALRRLLDQIRPPMLASARDFWIATAQLAAGETVAATGTLEQLASTPMLPIAEAARHRLQAPPVSPTTLAPTHQHILHQIEGELSDTDAGSTFFGRRLPWVTYILMTVNFIMFALEKLLGGSENDQVLDRLGMFSPQLVLVGHEYWRLFTANFLHAGWPHILFNMAALLILGPAVEFGMGMGKYLVVFLVSGVGSMSGVLLLQCLGWINPTDLVGASGAIMGLVGATGAIVLVQWRRHRAQHLRRRLLNVIWIVVAQAMFDAMTPEISSSAHLWGAAIGFATALLLYRPSPRLRLAR